VDNILDKKKFLTYENKIFNVKQIQEGKLQSDILKMAFQKNVYI